MVDKPRNPRRSAGGNETDGGRARKTGGPGARPAAAGRGAGKPGTGPASSRKVGSYDRRVLEKLQDAGLLNEAGRRFMSGEAGGGEKGGPRSRGAQSEGGPRSRRNEPEAGPRPVARTGAARPGGRPLRPAPAGEAERPARAPGAGRAVRMKPGSPEAAVAERLQKVMAQAGVASRRHSEELIQAGRVTINGKVVTELGSKVVPGRDVIEVDGRPLGKPESLIYLVLNKPKGYVTTLYDPQGRPKVTDLLGDDVAQRVYPVGRLDYDTEGLLLLTNDGELANALMHPARQVKKTYIAKVRGVPGPAKVRALEEGVELDDGLTAPAEVKLIEAKGPNAATLSVRIHEGRNRQVRRMFEAVGHEVIHLKRTTLGPLTLKDMMPGQWRELSDREVNELRGAAGLKVATVSRGARVAAIVEERKARRGTGRTAAQPRYGDERTAAPARSENRAARSSDGPTTPAPAQGGLGAPVPAARAGAPARAGGQGRPTPSFRGAKPGFGSRKSGPAKNRRPR